MTRIQGVLVITGEAEGAIPNGTRVRKRDVDDGAVMPGGLGTVYSSISTPEEMLAGDIELYPDDQFAYFIYWDDLLQGQLPIFTRGYKVEAVDD